MGGSQPNPLLVGQDLRGFSGTEGARHSPEGPEVASARVWPPVLVARCPPGATHSQLIHMGTVRWVLLCFWGEMCPKVLLLLQDSAAYHMKNLQMIV